MLDLNARWVQFHEIMIKSDPEDQEYIPLEKILPHLMKRIDDSESVKIVKNETAAIRISKYKLYKKEKVIVLLLQYCDKNVTDPVFQDLKKGELRTEEKLDGEGIAVSAHVAISIESHDPVGICYKFLLEEIPGLGRSRLSPFIKSELKNASGDLFTYKDVNDSNKSKIIRPSADILGTPTKKLSEEFSDGVVLNHIDLIQLKPKKNFDEEGYYRVSERALKIVPNISTAAKIPEILRKVFKLAKKEGYDDIKIRYKKDGKKQKTAVLGSTLGDITDALVVRTEEVKSKKELKQCMDELSVCISNKMVEFIVEEKGS